MVNVLKIISKQSDLSFIASPDVADKKITLYLNKVPLSQALKRCWMPMGWRMRWRDDSNVFVIKEKETTSKNLDHKSVPA